MSTATLNSLLDYLYGTLSPSNMRWVGEHLIEQSKQMAPYTMEELNARIDKAEEDSANNRYRSHDDVFSTYRK